MPPAEQRPARLARVLRERTRQREADRAREMKALRALVLDAAAEVLPQHGVERAWLFGSLADGTFLPERSDVDILVVGPGRLDVFGIGADLMARVGRPVHVVDFGKAPESLRERVLGGGEPIHGG